MLLVPLSIERQIEDMKNSYPHFKLSVPKNRNLNKQKTTIEWFGKLKPTPNSIEYSVKIHYELPKDPEVFIVAPKLKLAAGKKNLPHIYREGFLCLYTPKKGEWNSGKSIAETIVPWTALWLYYYEIWVFTGEWLGGGTEPNASQNR